MGYNFTSKCLNVPYTYISSPSFLRKKIVKKKGEHDYTRGIVYLTRFPLCSTKNKNIFVSARFNKGLTVGLISQRFLKVN